MRANIAPDRKRTLTLMLSTALVAQAKTYTDDLSVTMETLLAQYIASQQCAQQSRQRIADDSAADWNAVHEALGSFADEHRAF